MQEQPNDEPNAQSQTCPKCGGRMLKKGIQSLNGIFFTEYPPHTFFPNQTSKAIAFVCDNCGYAEIYAANPEKLRE